MTATIAPRPLPRPPHAPGERGRAWLDCLFAGDFPFPAVAAAALPPGDRAPAEHDAVARAAGCRDLFAIHADGPAGERAIAEVARSASGRVLVLTPSPAAADRIAERLVRLGVPALRALADDENPARPSAAVSRATSRAVAQASVEQARREAAAAVAAAEQCAAALAGASKLGERLKTLDAEMVELTARRDRLEADLKAERDTPFAAAADRLRAGHGEPAARLSAELEALTAARTEKEAALAVAKQNHADAARKPGLLARFFGGKPKAAEDAADLEKQVHALEAEAAELAAKAAELQATRDAAANALATELEKLTAAELATRRAGLDGAIAAAEAEHARAQAEFAPLQEATGDVADERDAERQLSAARQRAADVSAGAPEIVARALAAHRVVVAVPAALEADPVFTATAADPPFSLLVLDRAEELPESEFPRLARLAERWVLVGDAIPHDEARFPNGRRVRPTELPFVARLAKWLDREAWAAEGDRLVCRLAALTPDRRRGLAREPLADRPEVELRFADAEGEPLLAEIAFPAGTPVPEAKDFLARTLGEVLLRPCGELTWDHAGGAITARWPAADTCAGEWVELEPGVREKVTGRGPFAFTAAVSFDPAAGWDLERAEAWLASRLPHATSRFAALPRSGGPH